ncbi:MAG: hypothetical protein LBS44_00815 [Deltaproteobacteria bacterium]|jgi:hypothetical protein|nr:hypothetical protein [Deltaproteobacteria bacterium]
MAMNNKYGHISRNNAAPYKGWRWLVVGLVCLWALAVCTWNAGRVAALFGHHQELGAPLGQVGGWALYALYALWKPMST